MFKPAWTIDTCNECRKSRHLTLDDRDGTLTCPVCGTKKYPKDDAALPPGEDKRALNTNVGQENRP